MTSELRQNLFKANLELEEDWHGYSVESIWVELVEEKNYRINNTPFFARGYSYCDIYSGKMKDGLVQLKSLVNQGGHSTYRILFDKKNENLVEGYWENLAKLGCTFESMSIGKFALYAIDVPKEADINEACKYLELGVKEDVWDYETGHYGHDS